MNLKVRNIMPLPYLNRRTNELELPPDTQLDALYWPRLVLTPQQDREYQVVYVVGFVVLTIACILCAEFRWYLAAPYWSLVLDGFRWISRCEREDVRKPPSLLLALPFTTIWLLLFVLPLHIYLSAGEKWWAVYLVVLAVWRMVRFSRRVALHYCSYAIENHGVSHTARTYWQRQFAKILPSPIAPADYPPKELVAQSGHPRGRLRRDYSTLFSFNVIACVTVVAALPLAYVSSIRAQLFDNAPPALYHVWPLVSLSIIALLALNVGNAFNGVRNGQHITVHFLPFPVGTSWYALVNWCDSPPPADPSDVAPWSGRSPYGHAFDRRDYAVWNALLVGIPIAVLWLNYFLNDTTSLSTSVTDYACQGVFAESRADVSGVVYLKVTLLSFVALICFFGAILSSVAGPSVSVAYNFFEKTNATHHRRVSPLIAENISSLSDGVTS